MPGNTPTQLPAYIQLRYDEAGAFTALQGDVSNVTHVMRSKFQSAFGDVTRMADSAQRDFDAAFHAMEQSLSSAISRPRSAGSGALDLGVGELRKQQQAAEAAAVAAREMAAATRLAAEAEGDFSASARTAIAAADALAAEKRKAAQAAKEQADVAVQMQAALDREASATAHIIGATKLAGAANDNAARSAGAHRMAMVGLGQQMQDAVIQAQMGTSALTIFAQQGSQAAFSLSGMGGVVGTVARTLAGPWGAAVLAGTAILGPLIAELFHTEAALDAVKFSSNAVSDAQGILGGVMDIATGKITTQSQALLGLARAQLAVARVQSMTKASDARATIQDQASPSWFEYFSFTDRRSPEEFRRDRRAQLGVGDALSGNTNQAIKVLEGQLKAGKISQAKFTELAQAYANLGVETANAKAFDQAESLLDGTGGRELLKPARPKKTRTTEDGGKAAREAEALRKAGDAAAESIARINDRFDEAPKLIDTAAAATRELDAIIESLSSKDPIKFADTIRDAQATKAAVTDALVRPVTEMREASEKRLAAQELLAQGRDDEAAALQAVQALEQKLGNETILRAKVQDFIAHGRKDEAAALQSVIDQYPALRREAETLAETEARRTRELDRQHALFEAQMDVIGQAKRSLTDLLSGRKTDILGDLKQSLRDLQGARLFDDLFGGAFAQLEDQLRRRTPLGKANDRLVDGVNTAAIATDKLATAVETAASRIAAATDPSLVDGNEITVAGARSKDPIPVKGEVDLSRLSGFALAEAMATATTRPMLEELDRILGTRFMRDLSGMFAGIAAGQLTAGTVGGVLGGARGLVFDYGPDAFGKGRTEALLGKFDKAIGGATTGSQTAGLMKSLGIKTSTTGAQIGGAIGSFIPIPGGEIIGSVIGGVIGGMFKKVKWGRVDLSSAGASAAFGNSSKSKDAAVEAGGSFTEGLRNIIDQLGGTAGDFGSISLGVRHGDYRVNTGGTSLKKANGAKDFDKDVEAATKYALKQAIERGAIEGIKASTQRLIRLGDDLDAALADALDWENAFKELKGIKNPLGAALDDLDSQFKKLIDLSQKAGASAEEMAQLQELYTVKQAEAVERVKDQVLGSLQSLLDDLTTGDNGLSLRDRRAAALGTYSGLASRVAAGDTAAYDEYATAAKSLLDIERELYGSQQQYFDRLNEVTDLTKTRIGAESNVFSIAENRNSPFDTSGAVKSSIDTQTDVLGSHLDAVNQNIGNTNAALARIEVAIAASGNWSGIKFANSY